MTFADASSQHFTSSIIKWYYSESQHLQDEKEHSNTKSGLRALVCKYWDKIWNRYPEVQKWNRKKANAVSYGEWRAAGLVLDELTGKNEWKDQAESPLYDYELVRSSTQQMKDLRIQKQHAKLLYLIRTTWVRNLGNLGNVNLYRHSHVGTKTIIKDYMEESVLALEALMDTELDDKYLLATLQQTRRNIGRTALVLSGGGTFGLFHIGVLSTLLDMNVLPRVISGSSAGAIVASIISVNHKEEIPNLLERLIDMEFNIFKDDSEKSESENFLIKFSRFFKDGTWFDNKHLVNTMKGLLGELTFREAYNRTGRILNITVSPASLFEQPRLLNSLTAPNVLIWSAVCASCSLPGIFPASPLYEKNPRTGKISEWSGSTSVRFVDGSVDNDLPVSRLSEMFNVDHIIACQVNIHVFPFLKLSLSCVGGDIEDEFSAKLKQTLSNVYYFMANEAVHFLEIAGEIGIAKNTLMKMRSVLSQQYSGDVTILPDMEMLLRFKELLTNPTKQFLLREISNGARATWPKVSIIQSHCEQEFALDKAISFLKGKIIVSSSLSSSNLKLCQASIGFIQGYPLREDRVNIDEEKSTDTVLDDTLLESETTKKTLLAGKESGTLPWISKRNHGNALKISKTRSKSTVSANSGSTLGHTDDFHVTYRHNSLTPKKSYLNNNELPSKWSTGHIGLKSEDLQCVLKTKNRTSDSLDSNCKSRSLTYTGIFDSHNDWPHDIYKPDCSDDEKLPVKRFNSSSRSMQNSPLKRKA